MYDLRMCACMYYVCVSVCCVYIYVCVISVHGVMCVYACMSVFCLRMCGRIELGSVMSNVNTLILDGMDQAKFRCPRVLSRSSKLLLSLFRPTLHVAGAWLHGGKFNFFVGDEDIKKDPNTQMEMIARTLDDVYIEFQSLAAGMSLQQDNCS
jgi:hypothetical protein